MKNKNLIDNLILLIYVFTIFYFLTYTFNFKLLQYFIKIPTLLLFMVIIIYFLFTKKINKKYLFLLLFIIFIVVFEIFYYNININIDFLVSIACFVSFLLLIYISKYIQLSNKTKRVMYWISIYFTFMLFIISFTEYGYLINGNNSIYLTFNFNNSNEAAIYVFLIMSIINILKYKGLKSTLFCTICNIILIYMIILTNSRMILGVSVLELLYIYFMKNKKISKPLLIFVLVMPIIFVPFYLLLYNMVPNFILFNKTFFSGRQDTFVEYLDGLNNNFSYLFGNLKLFTFSNAHNGFLAVLCAIGMIGTFSFYSIYYGEIIHIFKCQAQCSNIGLFVLLCCNLHTCGEAALILGGFPGITFIFMFFIFSNMKKETIEYDK